MDVNNEGFFEAAPEEPFDANAALSDPDVTVGFACFIRGLYEGLNIPIPDEFYHEEELPKVLAEIKARIRRGHA